MQCLDSFCLVVKVCDGPLYTLHTVKDLLLWWLLLSYVFIRINNYCTDIACSGGSNGITAWKWSDLVGQVKVWCITVAFCSVKMDASIYVSNCLGWTGTMFVVSRACCNVSDVMVVFTPTWLSHVVLFQKWQSCTWSQQHMLHWISDFVCLLVGNHVILHRWFSSAVCYYCWLWWWHDPDIWLHYWLTEGSLD